MSIRSPALLLLLPVIAFGCAEKPPAGVPRTPDPVHVLAASEIAQVALGWDDLCVRLQNGRVLCKKDWRPEGARSPVASFLAVHGVYDAVDVSLGAHHACVRRIPGTVECWGDNASGEVGDATQIARTPHLVQGISSGVAEVKLGESQTCARLVDGTVRCWGSIAAATRVPPIAVKGLSKVVGIALGRGRLCARIVDGTVRCTDGKSTAVEVPGLDRVAEIAMGGMQACTRSLEGTVQCWNVDGTPTPQPPNKPIAIVALPKTQASQGALAAPKALAAPTEIAGLTSVVQLAAGLAHACALRSDGTVWCWGGNEYGQLGDGTRIGKIGPTRVAIVDDAIEIAAGADRTCARRRSGTVYCWGRDLLDDAMFHALTGLPSPPGPPGEYDSLLPELLRVPSVVPEAPVDQGA